MILRPDGVGDKQVVPATEGDPEPEDRRIMAARAAG